MREVLSRSTPILRVGWTGHAHLNAAAVRGLGVDGGLLIDVQGDRIILRAASEDDSRPWKTTKDGSSQGVVFNARSMFKRVGLVPATGSAKYRLSPLAWAIGRPAFETGPLFVLTPEESRAVVRVNPVAVPA